MRWNDDSCERLRVEWSIRLGYSYSNTRPLGCRVVSALVVVPYVLGRLEHSHRVTAVILFATASNSMIMLQP